MSILESLQHYPGNYELHLTVQCPEQQDVLNFLAFCQAHKLKSLVIELSQGHYQRQVMISARLGPEPVQAYERICQLQSLLSQKFEIIRTKIEASILNQNIPQTNSEALLHTGYFEHHVRLQLKPNQDLELLKQQCQTLNAHLSRNAIQTQTDGLQERFATQRIYQRGLNESKQVLALFLDYCQLQQIPVLNAIQEYIIYDNGLVLDQGWAS